MLLYSLPKTYENFQSAVETQDVLPKLDKLKVKIIEEANSRNSSSSSKQQSLPKDEVCLENSDKVSWQHLCGSTSQLSRRQKEKLKRNEKKWLAEVSIVNKRNAVQKTKSQQTYPSSYAMYKD